MHLALQTFVGQLPTGALYALVGVGFVIVYRSTKVLNFAEGALALVGGYFFYSISVDVTRTFWIAILASLALSALFGALIYFVMLRPLIGQDALVLVMLTIALSIVLGALGLMVWGGNTEFVSTPAHGLLHLPNSVVLSVLNLWVLAFATVLLAIFASVLRWTRFGAAMRAAADNPLLASYRGINVGAISAWTWALAMVGASLAGIAYGATSGLSPNVGEVLGFAAFPAIVLGGIDSVAGALVGALILAEVQGFAVSYVGSAYGDVVGYLALLAVLVVRPTGLFGSREVVRL